MRKKYYNMVEDMKGKIRVYCRARPLSGSEKERVRFGMLYPIVQYTARDFVLIWEGLGIDIILNTGL